MQHSPKLQDDKVSAYSKDQQTAEIRVSVSFHVPPGEVIALYSEHGDSVSQRQQVIPGRKNRRAASKGAAPLVMGQWKRRAAS